jgi:hypothetical protein
MLLTATILTLPCHKVELRPVAVQARLCTLFENACQGLMITPEQLKCELEANDDTPDLVSGAITPANLRLTVETLDTMRYAGDRLELNAPAEARRQAVLSMLANEPGITYALTSDTEADPDAVIITLAIRDKATCELKIRKIDMMA